MWWPGTIPPKVPINEMTKEKLQWSVFRLLKILCVAATAACLGCVGSTSEAQKGRYQERPDVLVSAPQNTEGIVHEVRSLLNEKRYQEGIAQLKKAIELDPQNMQTYIDVARAYFAINDKAAAEVALNQALSVNPRSLDILLALAEYRDSIDKPDQAEVTYKQAVDVAPDNEAAYLKLAGHYQRRNQLTEAQATLEKLAASKPQSEIPQVYLGDFFTMIGQPDRAISAYKHATEINPASTHARDKLIAHYFDMGNMSEAEGKTNAILEKNQSMISWGSCSMHGYY